jgi:hypothetical protein
MLGAMGARHGSEDDDMALARRETLDPAQRGAAPVSAESKRRVRLADGQRKGFETAWNEYFDCYATTTYLETSLIRLEDIAYHLYLKKNINPTNPRWELPSFRQLKRILGLSQDKIQGIEARLGAAGLLLKESGVGKGRKGENVANDYLLYEPRALADFLVDVAGGRLAATLNEKGQRRLAELSERFAEARSTTYEGRSVGSEVRSEEAGGERESAAPTELARQATAQAQATPETERTSYFVLRTSPSTPPAPATGTLPRPAPVPRVGTAPVPGSGPQGVRQTNAGRVTKTGTHNRPGLTDLIQQTTEQQGERPRTNAGQFAQAETAPVVIVAAEGDCLVARGITAGVAARLRQTVPVATITRQLAIFDALRDANPDDPKLTAGRLRRQIEQDWAPAAGFVSAAARAAQESAQAAGADERAARQAARSREVAAASEERRATLAALGLSGADQASWTRIVQTTPPLPTPFRDALFHAPHGGEAAAVIFRDRAALDRATGPAHVQARARVAARLTSLCGRPGATVHYLLYDDVLRLLGDEAEGTTGEARVG